MRLASLLLGPGDGRAPEIEGIVAMELYASALDSYLGNVEPGRAQALLDAAGQVLFSSRGVTLTHLLEGNEAVRAAAAARSPAPVDLRVGGEWMAGYVLPLPDSGWSLLYLTPSPPASLLDEMQLSLGVLVALVLALGIALMVILHVSLRPLVRLSAASRKLGSGDLGLRLPPAEIHEFEPLVASFNRMAASLEAAQRQLLDANRDLEERVRERTQALQAEHAKVLRAERLSTLGLVSSAIAHDLRSPLSTISLGIHWLQLRLAPLSDDRVRARLEMIQREVHRSEQIIRTLLAFARTGEPERSPADLNTLIHEVVSVVHPPESIALTLELDAALPEANVDRSQLFQVLENLLRNAIQAMPEGGRIRVATEATARTVLLHVSDTGPGIPAEMLESVFDALVTTKASGTGLGLALCKRIVDAHEGRIWVESRPGSGATFHVELPLGSEDQAERRAA